MKKEKSIQADIEVAVCEVCKQSKSLSQYSTLRVSRKGVNNG